MLIPLKNIINYIKTFQKLSFSYCEVAALNQYILVMQHNSKNKELGDQPTDFFPYSYYNYQTMPLQFVANSFCMENESLFQKPYYNQLFDGNKINENVINNDESVRHWLVYNESNSTTFTSHQNNSELDDLHSTTTAKQIKLQEVDIKVDHKDKEEFKITNNTEPVILFNLESLKKGTCRQKGETLSNVLLNSENINRQQSDFNKHIKLDKVSKVNRSKLHLETNNNLLLNIPEGLTKQESFIYSPTSASNDSNNYLFIKSCDTAQSPQSSTTTNLTSGDSLTDISIIGFKDEELTQISVRELNQRLLVSQRLLNIKILF